MRRREFLASMAAKGAAAALVMAAAGSEAATGTDYVPEHPNKHRRPLVAIVADNQGTETTDMMIPHAILHRSGMADVVIVSPAGGTIALMPALSIAAQLTLDAFDSLHPEGADYVIVPAFHGDGDPRIVAWLKKQFAGNAFIAGICEGAKVLGQAGLLNARDATTHWYAIDDLRRRYPTMRWIRDRRYVVDRGVMTTTGVSASIPASLALVESMAGPQPAQDLAARLGLSGYASPHQSSSFHLNAQHIWRVIANRAAFYRHEEVEIFAEPNLDGIALALTADPWSRTYRSQAILAARAPTVRSMDGLLLHARPVTKATPTQDTGLRVTLSGDLPAAGYLERSLTAISGRYGPSTAELVALQLEYAWRAA